MTADQALALAGVLLVGIISLLSLLGWVVSILMKIQTNLARLSAEMSAFQNRLERIEMVVMRPSPTMGVFNA